MSRMYFLGIDTSCYTTSVAVADETGALLEDARRPLAVNRPARGLRQSEMVFQHLKNLPAIFPGRYPGCKAVAASVRPRPAEGSYMPVFRAAEGFGKVAAQATGAAFYALTHQHAHIAAALIGQPAVPEALLALHVSGGTTDVLRVGVREGIVETIDTLAQASDITAGQFIDRIGVRLGLAFPAGPAMSALAAAGTPCAVKAGVDGLSASFSGAETAVRRLLEQGVSMQDAAASVLVCIARVLERLIREGREQTGQTAVLLFGGVMASGYIRRYLSARLGGLLFAEPRYATDNACGLARQAAQLYRKAQEESPCRQRS